MFINRKTSIMKRTGTKNLVVSRRDGKELIERIFSRDAMERRRKTGLNNVFIFQFITKR